MERVPISDLLSEREGRHTSTLNVDEVAPTWGKWSFVWHYSRHVCSADPTDDPADILQVFKRHSSRLGVNPSRRRIAEPPHRAAKADGRWSAEFDPSLPVRDACGTLARAAWSGHGATSVSLHANTDAYSICGREECRCSLRDVTSSLSPRSEIGPRDRALLHILLKMVFWTWGNRWWISTS